MSTLFPIKKFLEMENGISGALQFELRHVKYQVWDASYQIQPMIVLKIGGESVAMCRCDYYDDKHMVIHMKIFSNQIQRYKGCGIGSLMAVVTSIYCIRMEAGRIVMTSRSASHDAMKLFSKLADKKIFHMPASDEPDLNYLLGNKERSELGLPDKFSKYGETFFNNPQIRFRFNANSLKDLVELEHFFWQRFSKSISFYSAISWLRKVLGLKYRPKLTS